MSSIPADPMVSARTPPALRRQLEAVGERWRLSATISSPYDGPDRYADAFRVTTEEGDGLGVRELLHHHAGEQSFTRSLEDLTLPDDVDRVVVEGRDLAKGWGGTTVSLDVPPR